MIALMETVSERGPPQMGTLLRRKQTIRKVLLTPILWRESQAQVVRKSPVTLRWAGTRCHV